PSPFPAFNDLHRVLRRSTGFLEGLSHLRTLLAGAAQAHESARVGRTSETDLIPRPWVGVERGEHHAHHHRPGTSDVELVPGAADQPALGELSHDRLPLGC